MNAHIPAALLLVASLAAVRIEGQPTISPPVTESQQAAIRKEVCPITRTWIQANERSDFAGVMALYASTPDFPLMYADSEGKLTDFEGLQKRAQEGFSGATHCTMTIRKEMLTVLDADTALWAFQGGWRSTLKTVATLRTDECSVSLLFKRVKGAWKIVYHHESYPPPTGAKPPDSAEKGR